LGAWPDRGDDAQWPRLSRVTKKSPVGTECIMVFWGPVREKLGQLWLLPGMFGSGLLPFSHGKPRPRTPVDFCGGASGGGGGRVRPM